MKQTSLLRPVYFIWIIVPVLIISAYLIYGLPHVIWSYSWRPIGPNSFSDFSARYYTRCSYIGPYGLATTYPDNGKCSLVRFFKQGDAAR